MPLFVCILVVRYHETYHDKNKNAIPVWSSLRSNSEWTKLPASTWSSPAFIFFARQVKADYLLIFWIRSKDSRPIFLFLSRENHFYIKSIECRELLSTINLHIHPSFLSSFFLAFLSIVASRNKTTLRNEAKIIAGFLIVYHLFQISRENSTWINYTGKHITYANINTYS